ncbi:MAG: hypothetical protein AAGE59_14305 [Cyanobacteria bacterium P01_F01_bin.86]
MVRPGGLLVTDHDPQKSAWHFKNLGLFLWRLRLPIYRLIKRGGHAAAAEQTCALATELHHQVGDGVTPELFYQTLEPLGFKVTVFPHNHDLGADVLTGKCGRSPANIGLLKGLTRTRPKPR